MALPPSKSPVDWHNVNWFDVSLFRSFFGMTNTSVEKELWLYIRSFSEIKSRGEELVRLHRNATGDVDSVGKKFRSFVRQAESYWHVARATSYRSSPLLYYYSFLNLAKAYLVLVNPDFPNRVFHGLSFDTDTKEESLDKHVLKVSLNEKQVFSLLYKDWFETDSSRELQIKELLSYTRDISLQYLQGNFGPSRSFSFMAKCAIDRDNHTAFTVAAFPKGINLDKYSNVFKTFFKKYEKVDLTNLTALSVLQLVFNVSAGSYEFYWMKPDCHSKEVETLTVLPLMGEDLQLALKPWISPIYYLYHPENTTGVINIPLREEDKDPKPLNGEIAIYAVMFYLSELVRYRPDLLDNLLEQDAGWLLGSFVECCPLTFFHAMVYKITGQIHLLKTI